MLLRLACLGVANVFALLRLLPVSNEDTAAEILALRHRITVLERQLDGDRVLFAPSDRVFLAALRRVLADVPVDGQWIVVSVRVRRLACPVLDCPRQTFREQVPGVVERSQRGTDRLTDQLNSVV